MIPRAIEAKHIRQAVKRIDKEGVPMSRKSTKYDLIITGKPYPPKYVISLATRIATGSEHPPNRFHAVEAKNYFEARRYTVVDRYLEESSVVPENDESAFPEGTSVYKRHRRLERDATITRSVKSQRIRDTGRLECEVCSFDFQEVYGSRGRGFIEAHHTIPVSQLEGKRRTKYKDIALVCSNCHRMLHREGLLSVKGLRAWISRHGSLK